MTLLLEEVAWCGYNLYKQIVKMVMECTLDLQIQEPRLGIPTFSHTGCDLNFTDGAVLFSGGFRRPSWCGLPETAGAILFKKRVRR